MELPEIIKHLEEKRSATLAKGRHSVSITLSTYEIGTIIVALKTNEVKHMDVKEAKIALEAMSYCLNAYDIECTEYDNCKDCKGYTTEKQETDALNIAIEAIEKQIPKKPTESYDGYADGYPVIDYSCPNCGRELDDTDHHCICGQTIDWRIEVE